MKYQQGEDQERRIRDLFIHNEYRIQDITKKCLFYGGWVQGFDNEDHVILGILKVLNV